MWNVLLLIMASIHVIVNRNLCMLMWVIYQQLLSAVDLGQMKPKAKDRLYVRFWVRVWVHLDSVLGGLDSGIYLGRNERTDYHLPFIFVLYPKLRIYYNENQTEFCFDLLMPYYYCCWLGGTKISMQNNHFLSRK